MVRRKIRPQDRGRKPCISSEGPLVPYQIGLPPSLKKWCLKKGPDYVRDIIKWEVIEDAKMCAFVMAQAKAKARYK